MSDLTTNQGELLPLTTEEKTALSYHENVIEKGLETFIEVGQSLQYIRDNRLYRAEYKSFKEYIEQRWHFQVRQAHRIITGIETTQLLTDAGVRTDTLPESEYQARPLAKLKDDPELMAQAWIELTGKTKEEYEAGLRKSEQPTHKEVEAKVKEYEAQIEALKKANQSLENTQLSLSQELAKVTVEKSNYETKTIELESQLKAKNDEISNLTKQIKDKETAINELETKKKNLEEKEAKLNELIVAETDKKVKAELLEERQKMAEEKQQIVNKQYELSQQQKQIEEEKQGLKSSKNKLEEEKNKRQHIESWVCNFPNINAHIRKTTETLEQTIKDIRNYPDLGLLTVQEKEQKIIDLKDDLKEFDILLPIYFDKLHRLKDELIKINDAIISNEVIEIIPY